MKIQHHLPTGTLDLAIHRAELPPDTLFAVGARANPKRGFLFVSKVLGKHWPVSPQTLTHTHDTLAAKLPAPQGATLFIGLAETATGLAQGIFERWLAHHPHAQALYLHTTRLRVAHALVCPFEESHSHAAQQWLHLPTDPEHRALMRRAQTLVLIDDELSTGNTFRALATALTAELPDLRDTHWLCLTDFSPPATDGITRHSLLEGTWHFTPAPFTAHAPAAQSRAVTVADSGFGRLGITRAVTLRDTLIPRDIRANERILILGSGEFIHPAAVFARMVQQQSGADVFLQSTTRSPALLWGAMQHKRPAADPYDEGVPYYLYNVPDHSYDRIYLCHEHPANRALADSATALGAQLIHLQHP